MEDYFENFISRSIDGVFIAAAPVKYRIDKVLKLLETGIKVVMGAYPEASLKQVSIIENDYYEGTIQAVKYLYGLGHRKIAFLTCLHRSFTFDKRIQGYLQALQDLGLTGSDELIIEGNPTDEDMLQEGYSLALKLIDTGNTFSAVICLNDMMALGCMAALKEKGLKVPKDISVMGFDGIDFGAKWDPSLTTMDFPKKEWGRRAFDLLYTNMEKGVTGYYPQRLQLVERNSTGLCKR